MILPDDEILFVLYYYHSDPERKDNFEKCSLRISPRISWLKTLENLITSTPGAEFRTSMMGFPQENDYRIFNNKRFMNKTDMYYWFGPKFSDDRKMITLNELYVEHLVNPMKKHFLRKYDVDGQEIDILEVNKFPRNRWFTSTKPKLPRKSYGTVIH